MTFTLRHPRDPSRVTTYGVDADGSPWAEVRYGDDAIRYDATEMFDVEDPVGGLLVFLAAFGFLFGRNVDDALERRAGGASPDDELLPPPSWPVRRHRRRGVRRVLRIVEELELVGGR